MTEETGGDGGGGGVGGLGRSLVANLYNCNTVRTLQFGQSEVLSKKERDESEEERLANESLPAFHSRPAFSRGSEGREGRKKIDTQHNTSTTNPTPKTHPSKHINKHTQTNTLILHAGT